MNRECEPVLDGSASVVWFDAPGKEATASQRVVKGEMALQLANVLDNLPDGQREAVRMRHLEGLSLAEIAQHLDKTTVATAGLIKRGLQALRVVMSESDWR
jgi:RNA polymerase sigma-70 factor (ECF subfamily)